MPYIMQDARDPFDEVLDKLPEMVSAGQLGYVVQQVIDKYLLAKADKDTQGQLRYQYQGEAFGIFMSIMFDFFHCVNEPYENDVRARSGEVWKSSHRLPGHNGHPATPPVSVDGK